MPTLEHILAVLSAATAGDASARVELDGAAPDEGMARLGAALNSFLDGAHHRLDGVAQRLRQAETKFAKAFRASPAAISIAQLPEGRWIEVNDALAKMTGWSREECLGKTSTELGLVDGEAREKILAAVRGNNAVRDVEIRMRTKDGSFIDVLVSTEQIEVDGRPCALTIQYDITELRRALREKRRLNHDLANANKELEAFSYSVAHDLRAPLRSINGFSDLILEKHAGALDEEGARYFGYVRNSARHMGLLIDDLLALAQVTRSDMRRGRADLSALARAAVDRLRKDDPAREVETAIAEGLVVEGDEGLLGVALENLIGNAWKFTAGRPRARIEFGAGEKDGRPVYFVRDNGVGFDMAYVGKLFGVFQRLHAAEEFEGTGIGLATVKRVVLRHGGRIWAESKKEEGAAFHFTLGEEPRDG